MRRALTREEAFAAGYTSYAMHIDLPCPHAFNPDVYCATCIPMRHVLATDIEPPGQTAGDRITSLLDKHGT